MDILDGLDEIRILNKRKITLGPDDLLRKVIYAQIEKQQTQLETFDEDEIEKINMIQEKF